MQQLFPPQAEAGEAGVEPYAVLDFATAPPDRPYVFVNVVSTVDGRVSLRGRAAGLGSRTDRRMMRLIRAHADAILVGAATLRAEPVNPRVDPDLAEQRLARGQPAQPLAVTVTASLDLDPGHRFFVNGPARTIVLTTEAALRQHGRSLASVATLVAAGPERVDLRAALAELRARWDVSRLLCEGGPSLNQQLLDDGLLDEIFWTIAPKLAGGSGPGLLHSDEQARQIRAHLELISLFEHESELFARYRVRHDGAT